MTEKLLTGTLSLNTNKQVGFMNFKGEFVADFDRLHVWLNAQQSVQICHNREIMRQSWSMVILYDYLNARRRVSDALSLVQPVVD